MNKIKVTPVGTCRIHTPLRRAALHYPFQLDLRRNYGFVHTSAEVLQQLDLISGGTPVPKDLWPLIYRPNTTDKNLSGEPTAADFYLFEISSAKHVTIDGTPVQINYVNRYFRDFFSVPLHARRFWSLAKEDASGDGEAWLRTLPQFNALSLEDRELLSALRVRSLSADEVEADMAKIAERVGADNCVFITHVNAQAPDGTRIPSRQKLIQTVARSAERLSVQYFDPTAKMEAFGQTSAMERDGLDLTHYTLPFSDHLGSYWFETFVQPRAGKVDLALMDQVKSKQDEVLRLSQSLEDGKIVEVSRELHKIVRAGEGTEHHDRLLAKLSFLLGDYSQVCSTLGRIAASSGMNEEDDLVLISAHLAAEDYQQALSFGRTLLADERENDDILMACAEAARKIGQNQEAAQYWQQLLRTGAQPSLAADELLGLFTDIGQYEEALKTAEAILLERPAHIQALIQSWQLVIQLGTEPDPARLLEHCDSFSDAQLFELVIQAANADYPMAAATLLARRPTLKANDGENLAARYRDQWQAAGNEALEQDDFANGAKYLAAAIKVTRSASDAIRLRRILERRFRADTREAYASKDHDKVLALALLAIPYELGFSGFEKIVGRSAAEVGRFDIALPYFQLISDAEGTAAALLQQARIAAKAEDFANAFAACDAVLNHHDADEAEKGAALKTMQNMLSGALRNARNLAAEGQIDKAWSLLNILSLNSEQIERIKSEQARILRHSRAALKAADPSDTSSRLMLANQVLRLDPTDVAVRRVAALSAMREQRFVEARDNWQILAQQVEVTPQIEAALSKCSLWIERGERRKAA